MNVCLPTSAPSANVGRVKEKLAHVNANTALPDGTVVAHAVGQHERLLLGHVAKIHATLSLARSACVGRSVRG